MVHFQQFKGLSYFAISFVKSAADNLSLPMNVYPNEAMAAGAAKENAAWTNALDRVKQAALSEKSNTTPHPNPDQFRDVSLNAIGPLLDIAKTKLSTNACTP